MACAETDPPRASSCGGDACERTSRLKRASIKLLGFALLLSTGLLSATCGEDSSALSTPEPPPAPPNRAPTVERQIDDFVLPAPLPRSREIDITDNFSDPDGDSLSYSATSSNPSIIYVSNVAPSIVNGSFRYSISVSGQSRGTAAVTVTATDSGGLSASLSFRVTAGGEDDHGDSEGSATSIGVPSTTRGFLERVGDRDVFRFRLGSTGRLTIYTTGATNTTGELTGPGNLRRSDDDSGERQNFRITEPDAPAGTYYVHVRGFRGGTTGSYELHVAFEGAPPPPPRDDHGDTEAAATSVGVPSETRGELEEAGDVDVFRFRLTSSRDQLVVHTVGGTDTTGELVGPGGLRRSDDDSGAGSNFRITVDDAPAGTYYVHVRGFRNSWTGPYEVYVSTTATPPPPPRDDHGDTEAAATSVGVPSETRGELEEAGDVDVFRFRLTSSGDQLVVHTVGGTDTTGELVGPGGLRRSDDDSGAGSNFRITVDDAPAGTYYVHVRGFRNSRTGPYEVYVSTTATPPPPPRDDHGDTEAAATSVGVPSETRGELEEAGDVDVFRFRLTSSGDQLVVHTVGGTDTTGELVGPGGLRRSDDESGAGSNFRITVDDAPAGTYYVHVRGFRNSWTGRYELHVTAERDGNLSAPTGVSWQVTEPPDYVARGTDRRCGRNEVGNPAPGVYVEWDAYPRAVDYEFAVRRHEGPQPYSWDDLGLVEDDGAARQWVCVSSWNHDGIVVDIRFRAVLGDGSTSAYREILNIWYPANPLSSTTSHSAGVAEKSAPPDSLSRPRQPSWR